MDFNDGESRPNVQLLAERYESLSPICHRRKLDGAQQQVRWGFHKNATSSHRSKSVATAESATTRREEGGGQATTQNCSSKELSRETAALTEFMQGQQHLTPPKKPPSRLTNNKHLLNIRRHAKTTTTMPAGQRPAEQAGSSKRFSRSSASAASRFQSITTAATAPTFVEKADESEENCMARSFASDVLMAKTEKVTKKGKKQSNSSFNPFKKEANKTKSSLHELPNQTSPATMVTSSASCTSSAMLHSKPSPPPKPKISHNYDEAKSQRSKTVSMIISEIQKPKPPPKPRLTNSNNNQLQQGQNQFKTPKSPKLHKARAGTYPSPKAKPEELFSIPQKTRKKMDADDDAEENFEFKEVRQKFLERCTVLQKPSNIQRRHSTIVRNNNDKSQSVDSFKSNLTPVLSETLREQKTEKRALSSTRPSTRPPPPPQRLSTLVESSRHDMTESTVLSKNFYGDNSGAEMTDTQGMLFVKELKDTDTIKEAEDFQLSQHNLPKLPSHPPPSPPKFSQYNNHKSPKSESFYEEIRIESENLFLNDYSSQEIQKESYENKALPNSEEGYQSELEEFNMCEFEKLRMTLNSPVLERNKSSSSHLDEKCFKGDGNYIFDENKNYGFQSNARNKLSLSCYTENTTLPRRFYDQKTQSNTIFLTQTNFSHQKFATITIKAGQKIKNNFSKKIGDISSKFDKIKGAMNGPTLKLPTVSSYRTRRRLFRNNTIGRGLSPDSKSLKRDRSSSVFHVDGNGFLGYNEQNDDDDAIYGDDWSSTEDECEEDQSTQVNAQQIGYTEQHRSLYSHGYQSDNNSTAANSGQELTLLQEIERDYQILQRQEELVTSTMDAAHSSSDSTPDSPSSQDSEDNSGHDLTASSSFITPCTIELTQHPVMDPERYHLSAPSPSSLNAQDCTRSTVSQLPRKEGSMSSTNSSNSGMSELVSTSNLFFPHPTGGDDDDEISCYSELGNSDDHEVYLSRLPEEQPLYQHFSFLESDKLPDSPGSSSVAETSSKLELNNTISNVKKELDEFTIIGTSQPSTSAEKMSILPQTKLGHEKEEADSVCGDESAEFSDDIAGISVRRQSSNASASTDSGRGPDASIVSNLSMRRERLTLGSVYGSQRSLWCELPEVKEAGLLDTLSEPDKKLQEAQFEVITSEASYLRSVNFLILHFMCDDELSGDKNQRSVITNFDRRRLFSNILAIRDCSERLLSKLESRLKESLVLSDVCDILCEFFDNNSDPYVKYCSNQVYQERQLSKLKATNPQFVAALKRIESDKQCHGLDMRSFLVLPAQRITRYRLLVYAILSRINNSKLHQHSIATRAHYLASQVVQNCNESARRMERIEQLAEIESKLIYKNSELRKFPLVNPSRYVVKSGLLIQIVEQKGKTKLTMLQSGNRVKARHVFLFLFSDMLLITKQKVNGSYVCKDYAQRRFVVTQPVETHNQRVPLGTVSALVNSKAGRAPHLFTCVLMQNSRGKQVELLLNCDSESERERWLSSMRPPTCTNPGEKVYAKWDCPQARVVHDYDARQQDELELKIGELVDILRKMEDGWYHGEISSKDGTIRSGWFPSSYVQQILNEHVRANKYRERLEMIQRAERLSEESHRVSGLHNTLPLNSHIKTMQQELITKRPLTLRSRRPSVT